MSSTIQHCTLILHLIVFSLFELFVLGTDVRLSPSDVQVDVGNWATFNCSVSCKFSKTHTFKWFVGSSSSRRVDSVSDFYQRTGIQVELKELTRCESNPNQEMAHHQLLINVTSESVELLNKTAVQCAALRKASTFSDLYSHYGVIVVNDEPETPTVSYTKDEVQTDGELTSSKIPIEPTRTVTVTKSVTQTVTVSVTNVANRSPEPRQRVICNGEQRRTASLILTLFLVIITLSTLFILN